MSNADSLNDRSSRIIFLDWLRIFAFSSVLIGHKFYSLLYEVSHNDSIHATPRFILNALLPFFFGGGAGVVVFFLISGYIIHHVIQRELPLSFLIKRFFRIYPLYIFAVLLHTSMSLFIDNTPIQFKFLIPQLLLIGDFFNTPHSLNGVEWTLRIEIIFYIYIAFMGFFQLTTRYKAALPWIFLITVIMVGNLPAIPSKLLNLGYFNIYSPFLFLGMLFGLYENREIKIGFMIGFTSIVLFQYWNLIDIFVPAARNTHFSILAFLLFSFAWFLRSKFIYHKIVLFISELTYAVYLIHNWFFDYIKRFLMYFEIHYSGFYSLIILILTSAVLVRLIEKPGIKFGQKAINLLKKYNQEKERS